MDQWNKCDVCHRFIAIKDFQQGAIRSLVTFDTEHTPETWETLCIKCANKERIPGEGTPADHASQAP